MNKGYSDEATAVRQFQPMQSHDDCLGTCVYSVHKEIKSRLRMGGHALSKSAINDVVGYAPGGAAGQGLIDGLAGDLSIALKPLHLLGFDRTSGSGASLKQLADVCQRQNASFPVVALAPTYVGEVLKVRESGDPTTEHTVIVLNVSEGTNTVTYFEPFLVRLKKAKTPQECILSLPFPTFYGYWRQTVPPTWMLWLERPEQRTLAEVKR